MKSMFLGENHMKNEFQLWSNIMFVGYPQTLWGLGNGSRTFRKIFFDLSGASVGPVLVQIGSITALIKYWSRLAPFQLSFEVTALNVLPNICIF